MGIVGGIGEWVIIEGVVCELIYMMSKVVVEGSGMCV